MANNKNTLSSRYLKVLVFVIYLFFSPVLSALSESEALSEYQELKASHKAIAISGSGSTVISSTTHSQPSPAVASLNALADCEAKRRILSSKYFCEIRFVNNDEITPAHVIRAGIPDHHPLFLWKLESNHATVFLVGSIHVLKQSLHPLPQQFQSAFERSDSVVVEVDVMSVNPQVITRLANKYFLLADSESIQQVLSESELALLIDHLDDWNTTLKSVQQLKPSTLAIQLSLNQLMAMGYSQEHGVENIFLRQVGTRNLLQLETLEQQFQLLGSTPMVLQRKLLMDTIIRADEVDATMAALMSAWLSGDLKSFENLTHVMALQSSEYLAFSKVLLDERNINMVSKIVSYLNSKGTYFVMLGAAHLVGRHGVLSLLEQQGHIAIQLRSNDKI